MSSNIPGGAICALVCAHFWSGFGDRRLVRLDRLQRPSPTRGGVIARPATVDCPWGRSAVMSIEGTGASLLAPPRCRQACTSLYGFYILEFWIGSIAESRPAAGRPHLASLLPLQDDAPAGLESGKGSSRAALWGSRAKSMSLGLNQPLSLV